MKKFMFIGAAALAMFTATGFTAPVGYPAESMYLTTTSKVDAEYTTCKFNCNDFSGLELSGIVEVNLVKSDSYKVEITLPNVLQEYLQVYVNHGILKIGWNKNIPANLQKKLGNWTCKAEIAMPELRKLDMSGITSLKCDDTFDLGDEELSLDISGASKIKSLSVNARKLDAETVECAPASCPETFPKRLNSIYPERPKLVSRSTPTNLRLTSVEPPRPTLTGSSVKSNLTHPGQARST